MEFACRRVWISHKGVVGVEFVVGVSDASEPVAVVVVSLGALCKSVVDEVFGGVRGGED